MPVESDSIFARVIQDHLELKARNATLDTQMPIDRYTTADPFENHPLFKSEEQARIEDTLDGTEPAVALVGSTLAWPGEETDEQAEGPALDESLWGRSRDFDWGD
jgi:hypothetical protein